METKNQNKQITGFTLIELLVVVAIISLLSSIALIALQSSRQKSRDVRRLGDMTQMNTALELYFAQNRGYPSSSFANSGEPGDLMPHVLQKLPLAPLPADGACDGLAHPVFAGDPVPAGMLANTYFYAPSGTPYALNGKTLFPDYIYYFCLGDKTGDFSAGLRVLTPVGVR